MVLQPCCALECRSTPGLCVGEHSASRKGSSGQPCGEGTAAVYWDKRAELHPFLLQNVQLFLALCAHAMGCSRMGR